MTRRGASSTSTSTTCASSGAWPPTRSTAMPATWAASPRSRGRPACPIGALVAAAARGVRAAAALRRPGPALGGPRRGEQRGASTGSSCARAASQASPAEDLHGGRPWPALPRYLTPDEVDRADRAARHRRRRSACAIGPCSRCCTPPACASRSWSAFRAADINLSAGYLTAHRQGRQAAPRAARRSRRGRHPPATSSRRRPALARLGFAAAAVPQRQGRRPEPRRVLEDAEGLRPEGGAARAT